MVLTLHKSKTTQCTQDLAASYKYEPIMRELRDAFYSMNTEARIKHICGLEIMFNKAITAFICKESQNLILALEFLDEALIDENPLSIFGNLALFSTDPDLLELDLEDRSSGYVFAISDKYGELVRKTVLRRLNDLYYEHRREGKDSQARLVDFMILIHQYCLSTLYFFDEIYYIYQPIITICAAFADESMTVFVKFIEKGRDFESIWILYKMLYDRVRAVVPFKFAYIKHAIHHWRGRLPSLHHIENSELILEKRLLKIFEEPKTLDELRCYMTALSIGILSKKQHFEDETYLLPEDFCPLFQY